MKLKHSNRQYESTVQGKKMTMGFAADAAQHLAELMSNSVYQDKYGSIVREVVSNAIDANKESSSTNKVVVTIEEKPTMSDQVGYLTVQDSGPGISPERIENIFTQYFASTKRDTNEQIGGFGIGAKSPFAYTPVFEVITFVDGIRRSYLMEKSSAERTCTLVSERNCEYAESGTIIKIPINTAEDERRFVQACKVQLILLADRIVFNIPAKHEFEIPKVLDLGNILLIEEDDNRLLEHDGTMISLGDVLYKIPGENYGEYRNYVLKFNIGELSPTLSREGIELNDDAKVLIRNKHCDVTAMVEQWCADQASPTKDLRQICKLGGRVVVYPGTNHAVKLGRSHGSMQRHFSVKTVAEGWPQALSLDRFNMLMNQMCTVSARYHTNTGKWRSPNVISMIRDLILRDGYEDYITVVKSSDTQLSGVWKEYYTEVHTSPRQAVVLSITRDPSFFIREVWRRDLNLHTTDDQQKMVAQATDFVLESVMQWVTEHCLRYKDIQPSAEWLEARKEAMKARRGAGRSGKWTAEMLKETMPVKVHQPTGNRHREEWAVKDIKKPGVVVMQNRFIKQFPFEQEYVQPVTILVVSDGNFKRLQKAGAHCWTEEHLQKLHARRSRQSVHAAKVKRANEFHRHSDRAVWKLMLASNHHWLVQEEKQKKKLVCFHDLKYRDWCTDDQVLIDGQVFTEKKIKAQARNARKIMNRTICGKVLGQALDTVVHPDDSRDYLHNLLNPQQHG
jgi:hypothetical protein